MTSPETRDVVVVTGPWLAGSSSVTAALRARLPDRVVVEAVDLRPDDAPVAVVFVASAVAPLTASDCALLDAAAAETDLVIGAVSKVDVHRDWPDVLAADSEIAAAHDGRYAGLVWVGVAAQPHRGEPQLDELVEALERGLAYPRLRRNGVRNHDGPGSARITELRNERGEILRRHRLAKSERTIGLRSRIQQARVELAYFARSRCVSLRGELVEDTGTVVRRRIPAFEEYVARRVDEVAAEIHDGVSAQLADLAAEFGLTAPADGPPPQLPTVARPLLRADMESRLRMLFGAVLGTGVALTLSRLFVDVLRAHTTAGVAVGAAVGLTVAVWAIGVRRTLRDRAVLDRWVADVVNELRPALEQHVATRMLHADSALTTHLARRQEAEWAASAVRVAEIDDELLEHARRDSELPSLQRALAAVNGELNRSCE